MYIAYLQEVYQTNENVTDKMHRISKHFKVYPTHTDVLK